MSSADRPVVNKLIQEFGTADYPGMTPDEVFGRFAVVQSIKPVELAFDELENGLVDGSLDGGIDAVYTTVNDSPVQIDSPYLEVDSEAIASLPKNFTIRLHIVQSKNKTSWSEAVWEKLLSAVPELVSIETDFDQLRSRLKFELLEQFDVFRRLLMAGASKFPLVAVEVSYVCLGLEQHRTASLDAKRGKVENAILAVLPSKSTVSTRHIGVEELYDRSGWAASKPATLRFDELIEIDNAILGVASIRDFLTFIRDDSASLRQDLFDANVRDYEGKNPVNGSILKTLAEPDATPFWWLNNGVTIIGDEVQRSGKRVVVSRPLIVNGLQTSHVIDLAAREAALDEQRAAEGVVIRILESDDELARDRIISSTNNQTRVPSSALYAAQPEQRDIERFLLTHNWYYERRKNLYRNRGVDPSRRVSVGLLAQAMISLLLREPDTARARPSTGLKRSYKEIYLSNLDVNAYLVAIRTLTQTDSFLRSDAGRHISTDYSNVRFYLLVGYVLRILRVASPGDMKFEYEWKNVPKVFNEAEATAALRTIEAVAEVHLDRGVAATRDSLFKNAEFRNAVMAAITDGDWEAIKVNERFRRDVRGWVETKRLGGVLSDNIPAMVLLMMRHLRSGIPISQKSYRTPKGQLAGLSGRFVERILAEHGDTLGFTSEAGRTSRGTLALADEFALWLNTWFDVRYLRPDALAREELARAVTADTVKLIQQER